MVNYNLLTLSVCLKHIKGLLTEQSQSMLMFIHTISNKNSARVDIAPALVEITTACNVAYLGKANWLIVHGTVGHCMQEKHVKN